MSRKRRAKSRTRYAAPALDKGLDILECLAQERVPLTQTHICRLLGKRQSELFRMLTCLERRGYLYKDAGSGAYSLTLRLFELSHMHSPYEPMIRAASQPMQQLVKRVRESCHLSVLYGARLLTLAQQESPQRIRISVEVGELYSPIHTVSGRVLLAELPPDALEQLLKASEEYRSLSGREKAKLAKRLDLVRDRGYDEARDETVAGVYDVAVPVGFRRGTIHAALAIPALTQESNAEARRRLLEPLKQCGQAVDRAAGVFAPLEVQA